MSGSRGTRSDLLGATSAGAIVVVFCLILLWRDPLLFWNDDYELSILPVFADVARSWSEGHLPLLSPYSWVCGNLAGEYQYGTFSIFVNAAVVLIWKFPLTFPQQAAALSITHLFVLAAGAFVLARSRQFDIASSTFVALVAALNGWIVCWGAIDWFGALAAFAWLPWAWWALERVQVASASSRCSTTHRQDADASGTRWRFLWPAPFVYLLISGGFPYTVLMLGLLVAWLSIKSLAETRRLISILPILGGVALGVGLSAPAWLALLDYTGDSGRTATAAAAHWQWLVPFSALPGFIVPSWTVNWADFSTRMMPHTATELACGLVAPVAIITALVNRGREFIHKNGWDLALLLIVLVLCLVPSAGVFRWSFRWLPLLHMILALCAADALRASEPRGRIALLLVGTSAIAMFMLRTTGENTFPLVWILLTLAGLWIVTEALPAMIRAWIPAGLTFAALLATYLCIPANCGVPRYNLSEELRKPGPLDRQRLYLSVYPPAEHTYRTTAKSGPVGQITRPGSTSMWAGLRYINGYSPILASGIARELGFAIHGEIDPAYGEYIVRDQSGTLAELGVDGIVVAHEVDVDPAAWEWERVYANEEGRVFHRRGGALPTVRSISWIDSKPDREFSVAKVSAVRDTRNRVEAEMDVPAGEGPALITFSRPYFRGYTASLGRNRLSVDSYRGLMPMVEVPAGARGKLILSYRPRWLIYGGGLAILCAAVFVLGITAAGSGGRSSDGGSDNLRGS